MEILVINFYKKIITHMDKSERFARPNKTKKRSEQIKNIIFHNNNIQ